MGLISSVNFTKVVDRLGFQYSKYKSGIELGSGIGTNGPFFDTISSQNDYYVEKDLNTSFYSADQDYTTANVVKSNVYFTSLINALESHVRAQGGYSSLSAYCSGTGTKVNYEFAELYNKSLSKTISSVYVENRACAL